MTKHSRYFLSNPVALVCRKVITSVDCVTIAYLSVYSKFIGVGTAIFYKGASAAEISHFAKEPQALPVSV